MPEPIYTIGHSDHSMQRLIELLDEHAISAIVDVRSVPESARHPHLSRQPLGTWVKGAGIRYAWMGDRLGGIPADRSYFLPDGRVDYPRLAQTEPFQDGLARVCRARERYRIALLCSEGDPSSCHRHRLIAPALIEHGVPPGQILHILPDGSLQSESAMMRQPSRKRDLRWKSRRLDSRRPAQSISSAGSGPPG